MRDPQYIVSARKYRPATFSSVVGQDNLTSTLKNAIARNRLAQAYLFCGPRGVGKTSCARIFARTINCLSPTPDGEACGVCESCRSISDGNSYNIIELDAASNNSVNDIRELTEQVNIPPVVGKYRVFIIDEVHMLSSQAFNAFLKTLEEPPEYVIFILATTEKHKVIPTILSRCQIYDFKRISIPDMVNHLASVAKSENISADQSALNVIAKKADGAMRDALSIFDQVAASSMGNITYNSAIEALNVLDYEYYFRLVDAFKQGDVATSLTIYKEIRDRGFDSLFFINGLASHIRDLMVSYTPQTIPLLEAAEDVAERFMTQARSLPVEWHYAAMKVLNQCDFQYRTASDKQFLVELTLIKLCQLLKPATPPFDLVDGEDAPPLRNITVPLHVNENVAQHPSPSLNISPVTDKSTDSGLSPAESKDEISSKERNISIDSSQKESNIPRRRRIHTTDSAGAFRFSQDISEELPSGEVNKKREPVDLVKFKEAWNMFASKNGDKQILVSFIRSSEPTQTADEEFHVFVSHPSGVQALEDPKARLLQFLREYLQNDYLQLKVEVNPDAPEAKHLSPAQLLKEILSDHPDIKSFLQTIQGELE